ncbi:pilus assembly protein TadG-related protein [Pararhodobacter marinus]|uniref:pilus assembly protein TadG-related protein n=1 Tax=Pararhodobacter marinus TaxID=2184063 RepID=UPI00351403EC
MIARWAEVRHPFALRWRTWYNGDSGAVAVLFVVLLPTLLLAGALAIDFMHINAQRRYVQSQADLAALSAVHFLESAEASRGAARATVAANARYDPFDLGDADIVFVTAPLAGVFTPNPDQTTTDGTTAVQVFVTTPVNLYLLDMFMEDDGLVVRREAIAATTPPRVSFALSNCLAELALLRDFLRPLIGAEVDVLCSGRGVDTRIDLLETLADIAVEASLLTPSGEPATYGQLLDASLPASSILSVVTGQNVPPGLGDVRLGDGLILPEDLRRLTVGSPVRGVEFYVADLVFLTAELLTEHLLSLQTEVTLGAFGAVGARVRIGEPRRVALNVVPGSPEAFAQTSQIRVELDELNILGIFKLRLNIRLANAMATLSDQGNTCATEPEAVIAVFDPVDASLIDIDLMTRVQGLPLGSEALGMQVDTARERATRRVEFTRERFITDPVVELGPVGPAAEEAVTDLLGNTVAQMLDASHERIEEALSLQSCNSILSCATSALNAVAQVLTSVAGTLVLTSANIANGLGAEGNLTNDLFSDLLGLDIARADLELLSVSCADPVPRLIR